MATKLIALNSNKFLWQSGGPCDCLTFAAILALDGSAEIGKLGRFKGFIGVEESACLVFTKANFLQVFSNQLSGSRFNRWQFLSFCVDLMDGLATLDASCCQLPRKFTFRPEIVTSTPPWRTQFPPSIFVSLPIG